MTPTQNQQPRREFLSHAAFGVAGMAALDLMLRDGTVQAASQESSGLHHPAKGKHVIHIFLGGGLSQVDTFDYKPELEKYDDKEMPAAASREILLGKEDLLYVQPAWPAGLDFRRQANRYEGRATNSKIEFQRTTVAASREILLGKEDLLYVQPAQPAGLDFRRQANGTQAERPIQKLSSNAPRSRQAAKSSSARRTYCRSSLPG